MNHDERFVEDYFIVVENDRSAWEHHRAIVIEHAYNLHDVADELRHEFETNVSKLLHTLDPSGDNYTANIMREMLLGWGISPYEKIASELIQRTKEG